MRRVLPSIGFEAALVAVVGALVSIAANGISPLGLSLTRDYFPIRSAKPMAAMPVNHSRLGKTSGTNPAGLLLRQRLEMRLKQLGLKLIDGRRAQQLFHDPRFQRNTIVFVDARDQEHYQAGHIPGAYEFDPYRPEKYFPTVFPVCQTAEQVVVYCSGGDCDDSETAAVLLRDVGIAGQKILVYGGGITEWMTNGLPVETGRRQSGILLQPGR